MKLFLISQSENNKFDTYDSAVVIAENEDEARNMHPGTGEYMDDELWKRDDWCNFPEQVKVMYLGESIDDKKGVVCASFNAG